MTQKLEPRTLNLTEVRHVEWESVSDMKDQGIKPKPYAPMPLTSKLWYL